MEYNSQEYKANGFIPKRAISPQRRILSFLFSLDGAGVKKISYETGIRPGKVLKLLGDLELRGEVWCKSNTWHSTAREIATNPVSAIERLKQELEEALFNCEGPQERIEAFLEEYHAARSLNLSKSDSWSFAQRRTITEAGI